MEPASVRLTNADFRKLIATPRHATKNSSSLLSATNLSELTSSAQNETGAAGAGDGAGAAGGGGELKKKLASSERNELRRKKKNFYAALKKQEDGKLQELSEKYRDRARERRDNINNTDYQVISTPGHHNANANTNVDHHNSSHNNNSTSAYRAVAPDIKSVSDAAERRRRIIQESKFLGGDMEHTHLVKGLDYALLQKVRSELESKEFEEQEAAAAMAEANEKKLAAEVAAAAAAAAVVAAQAEQHNDIHNKNDKNHAHMDESYNMKSIKSTMARNIYNLVQMRRSKDIQRNELFATGRMAYVIDLSTDANICNDNIYETDIPTTLIRSKYEVPVNRDDIATLTTNDIVINKLAQILTYLRAGGRNKRNKKRDKDKPLFYDKESITNATTTTTSTVKAAAQQSSNKKSINTNLNIYDDIGEYDASSSNKKMSKLSKKMSSITATAKSTYFIENNRHNKKQEINDVDDGDDELAPPPPKITKTISRLALMQNNNEPEGYAECYPGLDEMNDAIDDSDDEVDYTKMDLGNKKGPIGRWDFDTQEEYSDYMSTKEALPKAAFQYGVKMQDGRKTRKNKIERNEKAELDREWQKIQNIIQKRKIPNHSRKTSNDD